MKLSEIFQLLTTGEMSQLYKGNDNKEILDESYFKAIGNSVQLGLNALYTRFNLKQNQLELRLIPGKRDYTLQSRYADQNQCNEDVKWIADTEDAPFKDDILKILQVITPLGLDLDVNNYANQYSCTTPSMNVLRIPNAMANQTISTPDEMKAQSLQVVYKANHPAIIPNRDWFNPDRIEVELPYSHVTALLYFVASRAHNPVGMGTEFNSGNQWYQKYELECQRLMLSGQYVDEDSELPRLRRKGFP